MFDQQMGCINFFTGKVMLIVYGDKLVIYQAIMNFKNILHIVYLLFKWKYKVNMQSIKYNGGLLKSRINSHYSISKYR